MLRLVILVISVVGIGPLSQPLFADDRAHRERLDQELAAVLKWEILWNDTPLGFQIPSSGSARFALYSTSNSLSYCSRDVGVCARYRIDPNRNWQRDSSAKPAGGQGDENALLAFVGENVRRTAANADPQQKLAMGRGGLTGLPTPGSGILWTTTIRLASREEINRQYRQMRPPETETLKQWIRSSLTQYPGGTSVTIACFAPSDPMVYYYVDRPGKESVVMAVYWDREREEWVVASSLARSQGSRKFDEMHHIIESVACSTVRSE